MFKSILITLVILLNSSLGLYGSHEGVSLSIGDGFQISKNEKNQHFISHTSGRLVFPFKYSDLGPLISYSTSAPLYIFSKTTNHRLPQSETESQLSNNQEATDVYFIINRYTQEIRGPFLEAEFFQQDELKNQDEIKWKKPRIPNIWMYFFHSVRYIVLRFLVIFYYAYELMIPVLLISMLLIWLLLRRIKISFRK